MAPTNRENLSLYQDAKLSFMSLLKVIAQAYVGFFIVLLITGGRFTPFSLSLLFCAGTGAVAWQERNRRLKILQNQSSTRTEMRAVSADGTLEQQYGSGDFQFNHSQGVLLFQSKISGVEAFTVEEFLKRCGIQIDAIALPSIEDIEIPIQELNRSSS